MDIVVIATVETSNVIDEINKFKWKYRLLHLCEVLDSIQWATKEEGNEMSSEEKEKLYSYLKGKMEWIESIKTTQQSNAPEPQQKAASVR